MEFGIGLFGDLAFDKQAGRFRPAEQRFSEMIEEIKLADRLGLDVVALGEHHRPDYAIASTEVALAALASVTQRIKLASGVTVLSSADPVKVYQNFATLDLLSNGRAEIIAGRGSFIESFPLYGYQLEDYDALFSEKLELLLAINRQVEMNWEGKFRAPLIKQEIYPRAVNERLLPIWLAVGGTPASLHRAGALGLPLMLAIIGGSPVQFKDHVEYYRKVYTDSGHDLSAMQVGIHSHTFVADSQASLVKSYFPAYAAQMDRVGRSRGWPPYSQTQFEAGMSRHGALFMGNPEEVAEKVFRVSKLL